MQLRNTSKKGILWKYEEKPDFKVNFLLGSYRVKYNEYYEYLQFE